MKLYEKQVSISEIVQKGALKKAANGIIALRLLIILDESIYFHVDVLAVELFTRLKCLFFRIGRISFWMVWITSFWVAFLSRNCKTMNASAFRLVWYLYLPPGCLGLAHLAMALIRLKTMTAASISCSIRFWEREWTCSAFRTVFKSLKETSIPQRRW